MGDNKVVKTIEDNCDGCGYVYRCVQPQYYAWLANRNTGICLYLSYNYLRQYLNF